jgi:hypothetical protein
MQTVNRQGQSYGIISKLLEFRAKVAEPRMSLGTCNFCDTVFVGCSSSRAFAHILGRPVLGQKKSNAKACVPMRKSDDNWNAEFKTAQKVLNQETTSKEEKLSSSKAKQSVLN